MLKKDKEMYQLNKKALISYFRRTGLSAFEAKHKAIVTLAHRAMNSDWN